MHAGVVIQYLRLPHRYVRNALLFTVIPVYYVDLVFARNVGNHYLKKNNNENKDNNDNNNNATYLKLNPVLFD